MSKKSDWGVVDFFCGCGGTSSGLQKAGMQIIAGIDNDPIALKTYQHNFPKSSTISQSVTEIKLSALEEIIKAKPTKQLVFAACAPCQPFSTQNRLKKSDDSRMSLLDEFHRFVTHFKPDYIMLENVPGLQKVEQGPFTRFLALLDKLSYHYDYEVKNAVNYGVPQHRRRLVLIASKHGKVKLPAEMHGKDKLPYKTVREAISKYPEIPAGGLSAKFQNHKSAGLTPVTFERLKHTPQGGGRHDWPESLKLECHHEHDGHNDVYGRLHWDKPSVTLTTRCTSISNGRFGHPEQDRALSVREAAALQSFDDDFVFLGNFAEAAKQVGNAVPVLFAKALGESLKAQN